MSIRNEEIGDLVLDAARSCLLRSGGRKVTVSEVARQAGVSRPTVYRRWPDITEIIRGLLTREVLGIVEEAVGRSGDPADLDSLAGQVVSVVGALRDSDLIASLWREQRDLMSPYVFERLGTSQQGVLALLADMLAQGQERGQVRSGDAKRMAAMVLLIAQSFLQSGALVSDILAEGWSTELHGVLVGYLRPVGR
ncbi:TetR/AcrR family transcriptional regulator [Gordonia sp. zg691]|uniref:TetR/AcrR family transcriptional regulator n=1 Tax=Gordonia jinghuaiqii TaxID=2758710 RepID=A0A7D7R307_9ACTN|nr:TetR/AcrR family transcriptional regulator [Gordonia jinghuaiqii]MBD0862821.1 TetR/AcrR family transcriptional regulator [Gordonia jinghuaiqii]MCR5979046.1 TetR family transcriptional regulator [Gordonia jinghuaiqii]QMT01632.1 TetR/AcrR family transcriptional regulator [Gordonia jinghuaiqii]